MSKEKKERKTTEELLEEISSKLERLLYAFALNAVKGKQQKDQILDLSRLGYRPKEIALMLGTTPNNVSVTLSQSKSQNKRIPESSE